MELTPRRHFNTAGGFLRRNNDLVVPYESFEGAVTDFSFKIMSFADDFKGDLWFERNVLMIDQIRDFL